MIGPIIKSLRAALLANSVISTAVGTKVFKNKAPEKDASGNAITTPYCVITIASGGDTNTSPRDELDVDVNVKFITSTGLEAQNLAAAARVALHNQLPTLEGGWATYDCQHEQIISYTETVERRDYFHEGGSYRLRATKDS